MPTPTGPLHSSLHQVRGKPAVPVAGGVPPRRGEPRQFKDHGHGKWDISYMDVSENSGTPKSSILIGFSIINHPFWGTPIFGHTHIYHIYIYTYMYYEI